MAKGTYAINKQDENESPQDTSFKTCVCTLLIFLGLCVIILLASAKWTKYEIKKEVQDDVELMKLNGDSKNSKMFEKMLEKTTTTTKNIINASTTISPEKLDALQRLHDVLTSLKNEMNSSHSVTTTLRNSSITSMRNVTGKHSIISTVVPPHVVVVNYTSSIPGQVQSKNSSITESSRNVTEKSSTTDYTTTVPLLVKNYTYVPSQIESKGSSTDSNRNLTEKSSPIDYSTAVPPLVKNYTSVPSQIESKDSSTDSNRNLTENLSTDYTTAVPSRVEHNSSLSGQDQSKHLSTKSIINVSETLSTNYTTAVPPLVKNYTSVLSQIESKDSSTESNRNLTEKSSTIDYTTAVPPFVKNYTSVPSQIQSNDSSTESNSNLIEKLTTDYTTAVPPLVQYYSHVPEPGQSKNSSTESIRNFQEEFSTIDTAVVPLEITKHADETTENLDTTSFETNFSKNIKSTTFEPNYNLFERVPETLTSVTEISETASSSFRDTENHSTTYVSAVTEQNSITENTPTDTYSASSIQGDNNQRHVNHTSMESSLDNTDNATIKIDNDKKVSTSTWVTTEDMFVPMSSIINDTEAETFNRTNSKLDNLLLTIKTTLNYSTTTPLSIQKIIDSNGQQQVIEDFDLYQDIEYSDNDTSSIVRLIPETTTNKSQLLLQEQKFVKPKEPPVCSTTECKSAASRMLSLINYSVDPCEDFYEFSCGGMQADNYNRDDTWKAIFEQINLIDHNAPQYLKTFKTFYKTCVAHEAEFNYEERVAQVLKMVKQVGKLLTDEPLQEEVDLTSLFANLVLRQSLPIIDVDVDLDKESSIFILKLVLPEKTPFLSESGHWSALSDSQTRCLLKERHELEKRELNLTKIHLSYLECQKNHAIYLNSVQAVVQTLGFYSHLEHQYNKSQQIEELRMSIEWDILDYLDKIPPPNVVRKMLLFKNYTLYRIPDLQQNFGFLNWGKFFKILTTHELDNDTLVQVYYPEYFATIFKELKKISTRNINNALIAMYAHNLYEHLVLPQAKHFRDDYCMKLSSKLFHDVTNNLYIKTWSEEDMTFSQKFASAIFNKLKGRMEKAFDEVDWLDDASRISSLFKLQKMKLIFNNVEDLYNNDTYLNLKYSDVVLNERDWYGNVNTMIRSSKQKLYSLQGKRLSTNYLWSNFLSAYDKAPMSFYSKYYIMVPLGMLKPSLTKLPVYLSIARIGFSLAKEIGRHFDPVGIKYGMTLSASATASYYTMRTIMDNESLLNVTKSHQNHKMSFTADAELSTNERIADNTALKLITDSFNSIADDSLLPWILTSFSRQKIFFITVAQEYCKQTSMAEYTQQLFESEILPASLRVENLVSNSQDFAAALECPAGSEMNNNPGSVQFPYLEKVELL